MNEAGGRDAMQQLKENLEQIIAESKKGSSERLAALARGQRSLTRSLKEEISHQGLDLSLGSLTELQGLVGRAVDAVRAEMVQNRGDMQAAGIKKRVLHAYGTVTVSGKG